MARLPSERYLIQNINGYIVIYEDGSEETVVSWEAGSANEYALAQKKIYESDRLSAEDKCFAHFWSGYFYANCGVD